MSKLFKQAGAMLMSLAFAVTPVVGVMAAPEDIIDTNRKASLTVHKYDVTAALEDNVQVDAFTSNGERDAAAEEAMKNYAIEGVEFTYAKVADINTESVNGQVKLLYDIPNELEAILNLNDERGDNKFTSQQLNEAMAATLADNSAGKNKFEDYINTVGGKQNMPLTDANGVTTASSLPLGLYLIVETKVPANVAYTVDPFLVSLPMTNDTGDYWFYDVNVYPKNQTDIPDLDKLVRQHDDVGYGKPEYTDTATASEGDVVDYIYVSHLPKITSKATYLKQYTFVDKMDKGLAYNKDVAIRFYDNEADARANNVDKSVLTWESTSANGSNLFKVSYEDNTSDNQTNFNKMTVMPTAEGLSAIDPNLSQHWLVVSYSATVKSDAITVLGDNGNVNDVTLTWERTSDHIIDTLEDRAKVYTFGINLKKTFSDGKGDPTKVQFVLQNKTDGHYIIAKKDRTGVYYVTDATKSETEENGTVFSPAADGAFIINGLEADTYVLTEIKTSEGYSLLKESITIDIKCTVDDITPSRTTLYDIIDIQKNKDEGHNHFIDIAKDRASATVDGSATNMSAHILANNKQSTDARVDMAVENTPGFSLPQTGGTGTILFTLAGCVTGLCGVVILTKKNKKDA